MSTKKDIVLPDLPEKAPPALVVDHVTNVFEQHANPTNQAGTEKYIPGLDKSYGLYIPQLRSLAKHVAQAYKKDVNFCRSIALASWPRGSREHRMFALLLLDQVKLPPAEAWELGLQLLPDLLTWEDCDQLCGSTLGRALAADPAYMDKLETWLDDENFWVRRAALVSTCLLRKGKYDAELARSLDARALAMCEVLLEDREPYVRKAVDWATREVLRRHYDLAHDWLIRQAGWKLPGFARSTLKLSAKKLTDEDQAVFLEALEAASR